MPTPNSFRNELLDSRSRLSGRTRADLASNRNDKQWEAGDKIMQRTIVLAAVALLTAQIHAAQGVPADLQDAIRLRAQAVAKKDAAVWDRLTTADFTTVLEDGHLQTKAERLTQLKGEKPEALPPPPLAERFSTHGNTVIQRTQGQDRSWIITVWVKDGQDWRVAAVQITQAPKK